MVKITIFLFSALIALTSAVPFSLDTRNGRAAPSALYTMNNDPAGNVIYAMKINADGSLSDGATYPTGGKGASLLEPGFTDKYTERDGLSSSTSVVVNANNLYVLNPGSNSITQFRINPANPTSLTRVGQPLDTQGQFPLSIAISNRLGQLCVANSGSPSSLTCFLIRPNGLKPFSSLSTDLQQTSPPTDTFPGADGDGTKGRAHYAAISFNDDSSALYVSLSNSQSPAITNSSLLAYPVVRGRLASTPGPAYIFPNEPANAPGFIFLSLNLPQSTYVLHSSLQSYFLPKQISTAGKPQPVPAAAVIPGSAATCWAAYNPSTDSIILTDTLVNRFLEVDAKDGSLVAQYNITTINENVGLLDEVLLGNHVYALAPANPPYAGKQGVPASVVVLDQSAGRGQGKLVQNFVPKGLGASLTVQGMASWPAGAV